MNKLLTEQRLYNLKKHEGGKMQAHTNAFNNIFVDLTWLGVKVCVEDKVVILLCFLPNSNDHSVTMLAYGNDTFMDSISYTLL